MKQGDFLNGAFFGFAFEVAAATLFYAVRIYEEVKGKRAADQQVV